MLKTLHSLPLMTDEFAEWSVKVSISMSPRRSNEFSKGCNVCIAVAGGTPFSVRAKFKCQMEISSSSQMLKLREVKVRRFNIESSYFPLHALSEFGYFLFRRFLSFVCYCIGLSKVAFNGLVLV